MKSFNYVLGMLIASPWLVLCSSGGLAAEPPKYEPITAYQAQEVEGWKVLVNKGLLEREPELAARSLRMLETQLYLVTQRVPEPVVKQLREVTFWLEENEPNHPGLVYHPDPGWLRNHDINPQKAKCIEIANARNFIHWAKDQPWAILHELAHAYHHQFLPDGFQNAEVRLTFEQAQREGLYDEVLHISGRRRKHYALTNEKEYFAESSESYFGTNDFSPFVRAELREHDPRMYRLLERLWKPQQPSEE